MCVGPASVQSRNPTNTSTIELNLGGITLGLAVPPNGSWLRMPGRWKEERKEGNTAGWGEMLFFFYTQILKYQNLLGGVKCLLKSQ